MEQSVIDKISPVGHLNYYYAGWRNGKIGSISNVNGDCIYRFIETKRDDNGHLYEIHKNIEDNPIVIKGIVGWWLLYRTNSTNRFVSDFKDAKIESLVIREYFDKYTEMRYQQFRKLHRDNPDTLFWDWDFEFYAKYIIPFEMPLNKATEALFDYISDSDIMQVRKIMNSYIKYLKICRLEKGIYVSNELKVLRAIEYSNEFMLEDLEDDEINTTLDFLESKGYIKVAWTEGHTFEDVRVLDKGRAYMKQLETGEILPNEYRPKRKEVKPDVINKPIDNNETEISEIKEEYKRRSFNLKVNTRKLEKLYDLLSKQDEEGKRYIDGDMQKYNDAEDATGLSKAELKEYKPEAIDKMLFNLVFSGKDTDVVIVWVGDANELLYFIDTLHNTWLDEKNRLLDRQKPGPKIWQLTRLRFFNGKPRKVLDERTGKDVFIKDPVEFSEKAFSHKNTPKNTTRLDDIITMLAPAKKKEVEDEVCEEFNEYENYETKNTHNIGQLSNKGFHDVNHKRK